MIELANWLQRAFFVCLSIVTCAWAGEVRADETPESSSSEQETIVVTADRYETDPLESGRAISFVLKQRMEEISPRTTPDILNDHPGVFLQKTNHGGGQPIIRGRYGNQILLLYDGIRINNSIFRGGNNQYLNTIGPLMLERVEILHGPGSVEFGSDAIGGAVNVIPQDPFGDWIEDQGSLVGFRTQLATTDNETTGQLYAKGLVDRLAGGIAVSYSDFGDLNAGGDVGTQAYTGYQQSTYDSQLAYKISAHQDLKLVYSGVRQINVPRTDVFTPEDRFYYDEQFRDLVYAKYRARKLGETDLAIDAALSVQSHRERWRRTRIDKGKEERQRIDVTTLGGWAQLLAPVSDEHTIACGVDVYHDWVSSGQSDWKLDGSFDSYKRGKLAPRAYYTLMGLYLRDEWSLAPELLLKVGGRVTGYFARVPEEEVVGSIESQSFGAVGSLSTLWRLSKILNLNAGVHQGFRTPNIYDLTATGKFAGGFDVANPNLKPERATTYEVGFKIGHNRFSGSLFYYYTYLDHQINRTPWTINGSSQFEGLDVYHRENIDSAAVQGIELSGSLLVIPGLDLYFGATWTEGNDLSANGAPLSRIPPLNGSLGLRWTDLNDVWFLEFFSRFALKQDRLSVQDLSDVRISPDGTPGFVAFHIRGAVRWSQSLRWVVQVINLTNQAYRFHGSGIDHPGFGVRTSLELRM